ncbi:MAG TPA: hypothetical protein VMU59_11200 [Caulobacteraceae bacterium]|nr:hypothetical protein [Caulobacteraceae bacterium]
MTTDQTEADPKPRGANAAAGSTTPEVSPEFVMLRHHIEQNVHLYLDAMARAASALDAWREEGRTWAQLNGRDAKTMWDMAMAPYLDCLAIFAKASPPPHAPPKASAPGGPLTTSAGPGID